MYSTQQLAAKMVNKMTIELMELTKLNREDCQQILTKQLSKKTTQHKPMLLEETETTFIAKLFH
mgnify:CR=1 FL=1